MTQVLSPSALRLCPDPARLEGIWHALHQHARDWPFLPTGGSAVVLGQDRVDQHDLELLQSLGDVPCQPWRAVCARLGWSVYGAVGLSWCQGATIAEVWAKWIGTGFSLAPRAEVLRPMRFINPALLVRRNQLSDIIRAEAHLNADRDIHTLALCANIAVAPETLQFDLSPEGLRVAPPQIADFLRTHLLQKTQRTESEMALIDAWSEVVARNEACHSSRLT